MKRKILAISLFLIFVIVIVHEVIPHHHDDNAVIEIVGAKKAVITKQHSNNNTQKDNEEHKQAFPDYFQKSSLDNVDIVRNAKNSHFSVFKPLSVFVFSIIAYRIKNPEPP